ncbi:MAG: DNA translocase FtsK 4TM domain-containing protein [Thiomicrorhabdus sp.]|nr:DNA translocase FtsK 4TM domain-containing protein [Thiomicrorhabdus sp.]
MTFKPAKPKVKSSTERKAESKKTSTSTATQFAWLLKDGVVLSCIGLAFFLFIVLFSYNPQDPGFDSVGSVHDISNYGGKTGAWLASMVLYMFGVFGVLIPFGILFAGWVTLKIRTGNELDYVRFIVSLVGLMMLITAGAGLANLYLEPQMQLIQLPYSAGGVWGYEFSNWLVSSVDLLGSTLVLLVLFAVAFSMLTSCSWLTISEWTGKYAWKFGRFFYAHLQDVTADFKDKKADKELAKSVQEGSKSASEIQRLLETNKNKSPEKESPSNTLKKIIAEKLAKKNANSAVVNNKPANAKDGVGSGALSDDKPLASDVKIGQKQQTRTVLPVVESGDLPSLELLDEAPEYDEGFSTEELAALSSLLEQRLLEFGVTVKVESVQPGPVVTRFEILPAAGVKVSQINNLAKDLARVLSVQSVRVVDVILGKSVVGIEIPNEQREIVGFREVLSSEAFQEAKSPLTIGLGKDIAGNPVIADIAKMPHLLVAGTTGSGKSVGVNSMILSLLYKSTPEQVRLIMVDPKMLELSVYDDIPHLLTPVVTDMSEAANALRWCVFEMDRRYQLMAKLGVRNIAGFNEKVQKAIDEGKPLIDPLHQQVANYGHELGEKPPTLETLPCIVVVVDEFADMIMVVGKEVEQLIARIAQKARAAGIHLILATQRPSVNVITGLIKANIPTRMSFMVSTKIDSRTILDQGGAEQLLGMGDMLFLPPGSGNPKRVHGAFVSDEEVHRVANFVRSQGEPRYLDAITQGISNQDGGKGDSTDAEQDDLYDAAVAFVTEGRRVSISSVQRQFRIGYNRAARIVEAMESAGVISTSGPNGNREVLAPKPQE